MVQHWAIRDTAGWNLLHPIEQLEGSSMVNAPAMVTIPSGSGLMFGSPAAKCVYVVLLYFTGGESSGFVHPPTS